MADPIAVSSWNTAGVSDSLGLTVFLFLMRGSCSTPLLSSRVAFKLGKFTHRLLVLKYLCLHHSRQEQVSKLHGVSTVECHKAVPRFVKSLKHKENK